MVLSWVCYGLIVLMILWGAKFAGFGNNYHSDFSSLTVSRSLRGLCTVCILFHLISLQEPFGKAGELKLFSDCGIFFVSVFFFYSGYGLIKSIDTKPGYLNDFLKTRVLKSLVIPFYINVLLCAVFYLIWKCTLTPEKWVTGILGFTLLNEYAWYPVVLTIFYLFFYILFYNLRRREDAFYFMFLLIIALGIIFCVIGHYPYMYKSDGWMIMTGKVEKYRWWDTSKQYWFCGEWWVNTNIAFLLGMIFANREKEIVSWFKNFYWVKLAITVLLFAGALILSNNISEIHNYWSEMLNGKNAMTDRFICFMVQQQLVVIFIILLLQIMMKFESSNPVTQFFGSCSLEVYLVSYLPIKGFSYLLYNPDFWPVVKEHHSNLTIYTACVFFVTVISAVAVKVVTSGIKKGIK